MKLTHKPEWIRYKVIYKRIEAPRKRFYPAIVTDNIYIYAHGEHMVRDILEDYNIIKIEREDKDGTKEEEIVNQFEGFRSSR